jgi:3D (Asp-Asp-Asp) domain-containing protein/peptidoglycan hydrolase CwlO-like protein
VSRSAQAHLVRCRVVPGETRTLRRWPAIAALLLLSGFLPARVGADSSTDLRSHAARLQRQNADLSARTHGALLDLYALDSRLAGERARIVELRIQTAQVRAARAETEQRLAIARRSFSAAGRELSLRLQQLYEQGDSDPVAAVLGAGSLSDALNSLDALDRVADQDKLVIEQTRRARIRYQRLSHGLAAREHELKTLEAQATQAALGLERAHAARASYLTGLATRRRLNTAAVAALQQQAQTIEARTSRLAALAAARGREELPFPKGSSVTVTATGYSLRGHTATGAPVGWGVVAVDPALIPLGTRMTIPGYGEGVAADTGSAVAGATIDLWFPTLAQSRAWGRRTVTITLH